jgi:hypothetical protein
MKKKKIKKYLKWIIIIEIIHIIYSTIGTYYFIDYILNK